MKKFSNKISIAFHFFPPYCLCLCSPCRDGSGEMYGKRRWSWWWEKTNSSLLSTVDELRAQITCGTTRESANDQTFNWNLSEDEETSAIDSITIQPKNTAIVCCLFIHFLCQLQSQHSATDTFHRERESSFFSDYPHRLRVSIVFHLFWRRLCFYDNKKRWKFHSTPLKWQSIMATDNKSTTTSTSTHRRRLIFITFSTFIGGF